MFLFFLFNLQQPTFSSIFPRLVLLFSSRLFVLISFPSPLTRNNVPHPSSSRLHTCLRSDNVYRYLGGISPPSSICLHLIIIIYSPKYFSFIYRSLFFLFSLSLPSSVFFTSFDSIGHLDILKSSKKQPFPSLFFKYFVV